LQIGIILYWEITQYVDLFPFNDVVGLSMQENIAASCANDIPKASIILILLVCLRWMTRPWYQCLYASSLIYYIVFLGIQLFIWWPRYIFGANPEQLKDYNDKFARTIKILPAFGNHIAVDLQHNILQLWTLAIIMVMFITLKKIFRAWKLEQMHNTSAVSVDRING
jgi:MFS superfamily sulfate permease-like transporter